MKLGKRGEELIKSFEKLEFKAYHGTADPEGVWTIGWGHTKDVKEGDTCTWEEAQRFFEEDTGWAEEAVSVRMDVETTQAQFDAMVSLAFNVGAENFARSTVLRKHNEKQPFEACKAFLMWRKSAGKDRRGLMRRRCQEALLYCEDRWL